MQCVVSISFNILQISSEIRYPVTWCFWLSHKEDNINKIRERNTGVTLAGDARFDSPGFSAKYATYCIQEKESKKIIAIEVGMKAQVNCSSQMEVNACQRLIEELLSSGLDIAVFASDRSTSVRKMMKIKFPRIKHQFDPWHWVTKIKKRLHKSFKLVSCRNLKAWNKSIVNMIWYSLGSSIRNAPLARQKILSIFQHVSNVHSFPSMILFSKCLHDEILDIRPWIIPGSLEMKKLQEAILGVDGKNLIDLENMDEFCHTGDLESLNSLILKYSSKTHAFSWLGMLIRNVLAVLDFNYNVDREYKKDKNGDFLYKTKVDRAGTSASVVRQKVKKDYSFRKNIRDLCATCIEQNVIPTPEYPIDPEAILSRKHRFDKKELVTSYASRLKKV